MAKSVESKNQLGFYVDENEEEFHLRPQQGDHMIRPKEPRKKRKPNIFREVSAFEEALRDYADGEGGTFRIETVNGGEMIVEIRDGDIYVSTVGEGGYVFRRDNDVPDRPDFNALSQKAKGLFYLRHKGEK